MKSLRKKSSFISSGNVGSYVYNCAGLLSLESIKGYFFTTINFNFSADLIIFLINLISFEWKCVHF